MATSNIFLVVYELTPHNILPLLRQDPGIPIVQETNVSFFGKYVAPVYPRAAFSALYFTGEDEPGIPQQSGANIRVQIHDVAVPSRALTSRLFYQQPSTDVQAPAQAESSVSFFGRYSGRVHARLQSSTLFHNDTGPVAPQQGGGSNIRVVLHKSPKHSRALTRLLYQQPARDALVVIETGVSFTGRFTPTIYSRLTPTSLDTAVPQVETNTHFLGRHTPSTHKLLSALRFNADQVSPAAFIAETQPHVMGRFRAPVHAILATLRQNPDSVSPGSFIAETNTHFLGRFSAPRHQLIPELRQNEAWDIFVTPSAPDTYASFVGKFRATAHAILVSLRQNVDAVSPGAFVAETNTHFIGRFSPTTHQILLALRQNAALPIVAETNINFLGRFAAPKHQILPALRDGNAYDIFVTPTQAETNVSFIGKFKLTPHAILPSLRQNTDTVSPGAFTAETNTSFLGKFYPSTHQIQPALRQNAAIPVIAETNVSFIGRHTPQSYKIQIALRQNTDTFSPVVVSFETNPHSVGRFYNTTITLLPLLRQNEARDIFVAPTVVGGDGANIRVQIHDVPTPSRVLASRLLYQQPATDKSAPIAEAGVSFLGQFEGYTHTLAAWLRQGGPGELQTDINANVLGRFTATSHRILPALRQAPSTDGVFFVVPEIPNHFLGRFKAPVHARLASSTLWHTDTRVPQVETNVNAIGRFNAITHRISIALRQNEARDINVELVGRDFLGRFKAQTHTISSTYRQGDDARDTQPVQETQPHFLGRFAPTNLRILPSLRQSTTGDGFFPPETQPHFVGRYSAGTYKVSVWLRQNEAHDVQTAVVEVQPPFLGKFTPQAISILPGLRQNFDTVSTGAFTAEAQPHFLGRHARTSHSILAALRQTTLSADTVQETQPHFLGRYTAPVYARFAYNVAAVDTQAVQETQPHFIGRFAPRTHSLLPALRQNEARDSGVFETNPHFLGRYTAGTYKISIWLRQNEARDSGRFETNPHFVGRYTAGTYKVSLWFRQNPALDSQPVAETQPRFIGRFAPTPHRVLPALRQNFDTTSRGAFTAEAQPHFIGRYRKTEHRILPGFRQTVPTNIFLTSETQPHFLGRFAAARHALLPLLRQNPDITIIPSTPAWVFPQVSALSAVDPDVDAAYQVLPGVTDVADVLSSHSPNPIWRR